MKKPLPFSKELIEEFCSRWRISELAVFGSALREDFSAESDVDILVTFEETAHRTLFDMVKMQSELKTIFGREVDLVSRRGLESSPNHFRRDAILSSAEVIFAA